MIVGFVLGCSPSSTAKALSIAWSISSGLLTAIWPPSAGVGAIDSRLTGSPCWAAAGNRPAPSQTDAIKTENAKRGRFNSAKHEYERREYERPESDRRKISSLFWQRFIGNNLVNGNGWGRDLPI